MPTISVIVPVYKVEAYLDRCVQSIIDQTFEDYELILVDDGSPDNCGSMCDAWAEKDARIRVLHKSNGGLSDARNTGIDAAKGEWLTFIDSDDYVHPLMLYTLLEAAKKTDCEVAICHYQNTAGAPLTVKDIPQPKIWKPWEYYLQNNVNATIACAKLYKCTCFADARYPVEKLHEDEFVTFRILFAQAELVVVEAPLYGYYVNRDGITKGSWTPKRLDVYQAYAQQIQYFTEKGFTQVARHQCRVFAQNICWQMKLIAKDLRGKAKWHYLRKCRKQMRKVLWQYKKIAGFTVSADVFYYKVAYPAAKPVIFMWVGLRKGLTMLVRMLASA
jgi:glycosyltransferase involved in cell wall biosynthesis